MPKQTIKKIQLDQVGKVAEIKARVQGLEAEEIKRNPKYKVPVKSV